MVFNRRAFLLLVPSFHKSIVKLHFVCARCKFFCMLPAVFLHAQYFFVRILLLVWRLLFHCFSGCDSNCCRSTNVTQIGAKTRNMLAFIHSMSGFCTHKSWCENLTSVPSSHQSALTALMNGLSFIVSLHFYSYFAHDPGTCILNSPLCQFRGSPLPRHQSLSRRYVRLHSPPVFRKLNIVHRVKHLLAVTYEFK